MKVIAAIVMIGACLGFLNHRALAACNIDGHGNVDMSCDPGEIHKNGDGKAILALNPGQYTLSMDGKGNLCLTGLDDYSGVGGSKNGDGHLIWIPGDQAKGRGPKVQKNGNGPIRRGTSTDLSQCQ